MSKLLERYRKNESIIRISRFFDSNDFSGIVLNYSKDYILIKYEYDFLFDGFRIVRRKDIQKIKYNAIDKYHEFIIKKETKNKLIGKYPDIDVTNGLSIIESIKKKKLFAIFEIETNENNQFLLGEIDSFDMKHVSINHIDGIGVQQKKPINIAIEDITLFQIGNRYLARYKKYKRLTTGSS